MKREIPIFQIDAFTSRVFQGNPAAVCPLEDWLEDSVMQAISRENNLSETAFFVREGKDYWIRWFTPEVEVKLCGHATLASAYVIFYHLNQEQNEITFHSKSGPLRVKKEGELLSMDFPSKRLRPCKTPQELVEGLGKTPLEALFSDEYLAVFSSEKEIREIAPSFEKLKRLKARAVIVTARGEKADFVSRFFAPRVGVNEDPVTGSAHCILTPYWAERLNKKKLHAFQLSKRGGELYCTEAGERTIIAGRAAAYMQGTITLDL